MSPSQKDDDGQEWAAWDMKVGIEPNVRTYPRIVAGKRIVAMFSGDEDGIRNRDRILADHRDAQQLREQLPRLREESLHHNELATRYFEEWHDWMGRAEVLRERVRVLEEAAFLQRFQLRTAWFNLGCRCGFDDQHHKLFEDAHCPWHGTQVTKDSWEAVAGFSDDGTPLLPSSVATEGDHV